MIHDNYCKREQQWDISKNEDFQGTKEKILDILKEQKVSLAKTRALFHIIINEIEDNNPITL